MLKLLSRDVAPLSEITEQDAAVRRVADGTRQQPPNPQEYYIVHSSGEIPDGYKGYFFFGSPAIKPPANSYILEPALSYLRDGDIVKLYPRHRMLRTLYRRNSRHNSLLVTERCNSLCLMCSQPPRDADDSYLIADILQTIPLMSPQTTSIGITGGEPTLLGQNLIKILQCLKQCLPNTAIHILSNGRNFQDWKLAQAVAGIGHADLMIGVPLYSDISSIHDFVVQADGAFDQTIRGILNLKSAGVKVEIRIVIHKLTYERLPELARFLRRNLTFCDHVALMGLELTGFTRTNLATLWIDPRDYQPQLKEAAYLLNDARLSVSIYNHQLCVLDPELAPFNRRSISDWKNEYMPECEECIRKSECGGFFSTSKLKYSAHIKSFRA